MPVCACGVCAACVLVCLCACVRVCLYSKWSVLYTVQGVVYLQKHAVVVSPSSEINVEMVEVAEPNYGILQRAGRMNFLLG